MSENLYFDISEKLEELIAGMEVGDKLASERTLAEQFHVSRHVVREALRVLEEKGIIEIHQGRGAFVIDRKDVKLADQLESILGRGQQSLSAIMEVRQALELGVFEKAVERANHEDILELERIYQKMEENRGDPQGFISADIEFHNQLAAAAHNNVFQVLISTFYHVGGGQYFRLTKMYPEALRDAQIEHWKMIDAIRKRDVEMMLQVGREHFDIARYGL